MLKYIRYILLSTLLSTSVLAHENGWMSSINFFSSCLNSTKKSSAERETPSGDGTNFSSLEETTASSFRFSGVDKIVQKVMTPLDGTSVGYLGEWRHGKTVILECLDGIKLNGQWLKVNDQGPTMLLFHGNGMISQDYERWAEWFKARGINTLAFTIRGYPGSEGTSQEIAYASALDVEAALRHLVIKENIPLENIGLYGFSLGSGYASFASRYFGCPVIFQNAISEVGDTIRNVISHSLPKNIANGIARSHLDNHRRKIDTDSLGLFGTMGMTEIPFNSFNNVENLKHVTAPVMVIYAENDSLMNGRDDALKLYQARYNSKDINCNLFVEISGGSHTDVFLNQFHSQLAVEKFLTTIFEDYSKK